MVQIKNKSLKETSHNTSFDCVSMLVHLLIILFRKNFIIRVASCQKFSLPLFCSARLHLRTMATKRVTRSTKLNETEDVVTSPVAATVAAATSSSTSSTTSATPALTASETKAGERQWSKAVTRTFWGVVMMCGFVAILLSDHVLVSLFVVVLQVLVFKEMMYIRYQQVKEQQLWGFRTLHWYELSAIVCIFFCISHSLFFNRYWLPLFQS
jgi:hypothetical protein